MKTFNLFAKKQKVPTDLTKETAAYVKILACIKSCKTDKQLDVCKRMFINFKKKYANIEDGALDIVILNAWMAYYQTIL